MKDNKLDIEAAAQQLLDAADPEMLKRFDERFGKEVASCKSEIKFDSITFHDGVLSNEPIIVEDDAKFDIFEKIRDMIEKNSNNFSEEEKQLALKNCEQYCAQNREDLATKTNPALFVKVIDDLNRLDGQLREHALDCGHGVDIKALREALTRDTYLQIDIPTMKGAKKGRRYSLRGTAPLTHYKRMMLLQLMRCLLDLAAYARKFESSSENKFKAVYLTIMRAAGAVGTTAETIAHLFPKKVAESIITGFCEGYEELVVDALTLNHYQHIWGVENER